VLLRKGSVVALEGPLGVGKTTFARGVLRGLGVDDPITSPTYTLVNEYELPAADDSAARMAYHVDLYRIERSIEFELVGSDELLNGEAIAIVEWSEKAASLLPAHAIFVRFSIEPGGARNITVTGPENADTGN